MHFTYVIGSLGWHVKIGHSRDPDARARELQTGSAHSIWVAHKWALAQRTDAAALEAALHRAFAWRVMEGEWFDLTAPPVIAVGNLIHAGRAEDAERLLAIIHRRDAILAEEEVLRQAWRWVPGRERRRAELETSAARKALEAEDAALQLTAFDLGLWPAGTSERALPNALERLRLLAA